MTDQTVRLIQNITTFFTISLGLAALFFAFKTSSSAGMTAMLLLGFVTLGTGYDFVSHIVGRGVTEPRPSLEIYAKFNFAALCFGIPFTSLAASFVVAEIAPEGLNATLVTYWAELLFGSLLFGAMFFFARYKTYNMHGGIEYTLDKSHGYTRAIFITRRVLLALALVLSLVAVWEGLGSSMSWWTIVYGVLFIATVPLHILHRPIASMLSEAATLLVLFYGSYRVFVA